MFSRAAAMLLTVLMAFAGAQTAQGEVAVTDDQAAYDISSGAVRINSSNLGSWNNRTITGTLDALCDNERFTLLGGTSHGGAIIVDGVTVSLTISDLSVTATSGSQHFTMVSPVLLANGATLNLTLVGSNALTACSIRNSATPGDDDAAGIGGGFAGDGDVVIDGGTVTAYGLGSPSAAIGCGIKDWTNAAHNPSSRVVIRGRRRHRKRHHQMRWLHRLARRCRRHQQLTLRPSRGHWQRDMGRQQRQRHLRP